MPSSKGGGMEIIMSQSMVNIRIVGELPEETAFQMFMDGVNGFSDDFMADSRIDEIPT